MEYKILLGYTEQQLEERVTEAMQDGWKIAGSLVVTVFNDDSYFFHQSLIRETKD